MKRILLFASVLIVAILGTYFFQERRVVKKEEKQRQATQAIQELNSWIELALPQITIKKSAEQKMFLEPGNYPVDQKIYQEFEKIFSSLMIVDDLIIDSKKGQKHSDFFPPNPFYIHVKIPNGQEILYRFGTFNTVSSRFVLEKVVNGQSAFYIVRSDYDMEGFFQSDKDFEEQKYTMTVGWITSHRAQWLEKDFSVIWNLDKIESIELEPMNAQRSFKVDFVNKTTTPRPPKGLGVANLTEKTMLDILSHLAIEDIRPKPEGQSKPVATLVLWKNDSHAIQLVLWKGEENNFWVAYPNREEVLMLTADSVKIFQMNVQDFWDRRIAVKETYKADVPLIFEILQQDKWTTFEVSDNGGKDLFRIVKGESSWAQKERQVLLLLAMLLQKDQKMADKLLFHEFKEALKFAEQKSTWFDMRIQGSKLAFIKNDQFLVIYDREKKISYVFNWSTLSDWWKDF